MNSSAKVSIYTNNAEKNRRSAPIPLNYHTKDVKDMEKYTGIVKNFVSRCIDSMNK
jgi:hypothetical protein